MNSKREKADLVYVSKIAEDHVSKRSCSTDSLKDNPANLIVRKLITKALLNV